jgi:Mn2+/Fe2+ NRAMP family transporter
VEKKAAGKHTLRQRRGTSDGELRSSFWDVTFGMLFSNVVMYFIILATAATLFAAGRHNIDHGGNRQESSQVHSFQIVRQ